VALRKTDQPWAASFRLYVALGCWIVVVRVLFRIVFGGGDGPTVLFRLPEVPLPDVAAGIRLLGPVTREAVLAGLYDGLRLATLVICIGAANALANPKRLLRSLPPALYEIGTALVVATTVLPQFADSARRVRAAQGLRGGPAGRFAGLRRVVVPVLEDALERSLRLAAGMDARGYGRSGSATARARAVTGALMLTALCGICVGVYVVLDTTAPRLLAVPMLAVGVALASAGLVSAGRRVRRTRYRPDRWRWPELAVACSGVATGVLGWWLAGHDLSVAYPGVAVVPVLSPAVLVAAGIALGGAVCAPPAPTVVGS
jgi:energy-coupling factor transport system permease protein